MHESAGLGDPRLRVEPIDRIDNYDEWVDYDNAVKGFDASQKAAEAAEKAVAEDHAALDEALRHAAGNPDDDPGVKKAKAALAEAEAKVKRTPLEDFLKANHIPDAKAALLASRYDNQGRYKPYGTLSTWPWFEDRGPNPFLLATGQLGKPWEVGHFWEWFLTQQIPVLIEPLVKLLLPVVYFFSPGADLKGRLYFLCVLIWTVVTWSVFGGAITRIAAVQVARGEKIGLVDAVRFTLKRILSYVTAPLFPLLFIFVLLVVMVLFGLPFMIPVFGDFMAGLLWPVMILLGLLMAVALVGLVGWPLMAATVSAEGTDSWEAVSRSYSYVYQKPWHFIWYGLVAIAYGAVIVFFVGFMGSLAVYLAKWGVSQTPGITAVHREPNFLFAYAPTSFGWRSLLLKGAVVDGRQVVDSDGQIDYDDPHSPYNQWIGRDDSYNGPDRLAWWNMIAAALVGIWLAILFLLILGFGYSYFWSASTIIYMLLRRKVDAAEMDEVYLEDEDGEGAFGGPLTAPAAPPAPAVKPGTQSLTMVDAPSLRPTNPVAPPPAPPPLSSPMAPGAAAAATAPAPLPERDEVETRRRNNGRDDLRSGRGASEWFSPNPRLRFGLVMPPKRAADGATDPAVQRPVGRPAPGRTGAATRRVGLPGRRSLLLGRSLRGPARPQRRRLLHEQAGPAQPPGAGRSGRELPSRQPCGVRRDRRPTPGHPARLRLGRRRSRGRAAAGGPGGDGRGPRRSAPRRVGIERLHRLTDLVGGVRLPVAEAGAAWPTPTASSPANGGRCWTWCRSAG